MALDVECAMFAKETTGSAGATQDVTTGFTPKAGLFQENWTLVSANGVDDLGAIYISYGFSDGTNNRAMISGDLDGQSNSQSRHYQNASNCFIGLEGATAIRHLGSVAFGTNKFTVTWNTNTTKGSYCFYMVWGGADITGVQVGTITKTTSGAPTTQSVSTDADVQSITDQEGILMMLSTSETTEASVLSDMQHTFGITDGINESCYWYGGDRNTTSSEYRSSFTSSKCIQLINGIDGTLTAEADFGGFTSGGFDLDWTTNSAVADLIYFMIIKGGQWETGTDSGATSTGDDVVTTAFEPKGVVTIMSRQTTETLARSHFTNGMGAADGTNMASMTGSGLDVVTSMRMSGANDDDEVVKSTFDNGFSGVTLDGEGNLKSFNATDFTIDMTNAFSAAWLFQWFVCGDGGAAPVVRKTFQSIYPNTGTMI